MGTEAHSPFWLPLSSTNTTTIKHLTRPWGGQDIKTLTLRTVNLVQLLKICHVPEPRWILSGITVTSFASLSASIVLVSASISEPSAALIVVIYVPSLGNHVGLIVTSTKDVPLFFNKGNIQNCHGNDGPRLCHIIERNTNGAQFSAGSRRARVRRE